MYQSFLDLLEKQGEQGMKTSVIVRNMYKRLQGEPGLEINYCRDNLSGVVWGIYGAGLINECERKQLLNIFLETIN